MNFAIIILNSSDEPIYQQIVNQIKGMIFSGQLSEGDALPSIRNLAKDLQVSVITTKRAYEELEREGFIYSFTGRGSFVSEGNKAMLREKNMEILKEKIEEVIKESRILKLSSDELINIIKLIEEETK